MWLLKEESFDVTDSGSSAEVMRVLSEVDVDLLVGLAFRAKTVWFVCQDSNL
jgi:hypothetical protein